MCFPDQKYTVAIGEEEDDIPVRETMAHPRCFVVQIDSYSVSSPHNSCTALLKVVTRLLPKIRRKRDWTYPV